MLDEFGVRAIANYAGQRRRTVRAAIESGELRVTPVASRAAIDAWLRGLAVAAQLPDHGVQFVADSDEPPKRALSA